MKLRHSITGTLLATLMSTTAGAALAEGTYDEALRLDPANFTTLSVTVDGAPMTVRRYEAVYAGAPAAINPQQPARRMGPGGSPTTSEQETLADTLAFQKLIIYVPESSVENQDTAMIFAVNNGGWFASAVRSSIEDGGNYVSTSDTDKAGAALAAGYVFVDVGTRSRGLVAADDTAAGKAPAVVVDAKAAIRFLRLNDDILPGSAERIVITGTSGGGGLSTAVAASGNDPVYYPYLAEIGAAGIGADGTSSLNDDVFAVIAYCPITDLGHADMAYEWQYQGVRATSELSDLARAASTELAAAYPAYLAGLNVTLADGTPLTVDTMPDALRAELVKTIEEHLANGGSIPARGEMFSYTNRGETAEVENTWITVADGKVTELDIDAFLTFVTQTSQLKAIPAFDRTANSGNEGVDGENSLFGPADLAYANFTPYGWNNNSVTGDGSGADDTGMDWDTYLTTDEGRALEAQRQLINPLDHLTTGEAAPYWYLRHGMIDRDTAFAVEITLYNAIRALPEVVDANFKLAFMTPHSGDYDVQEAYRWLAGALNAAGTPN